MAIRIGFGDRAINFVFGARDDVTPTLKNVKRASEDLVHGLEQTSKRMESTLDNLARLVENTSTRMGSDDKSFFSGASLGHFRKEVEELKKVFEDMAVSGRQGFSDIANELEMVGGRMRRTKGETGELKDKLRELSQYKLKLQDAAAAVGVGFGAGKVISDTKQISETLDTMAIRMKNIGVTGDDLRKTLGDSMSEAKGTIGETLSMMDEAQKAGINNLDVIKKLTVDVERLSQFGGTDRVPTIQMLSAMNTQLGLGTEQIHNLLEATNELTKTRYGAGSLNETLGFVGGLTPQLQQLANLRKEFGKSYGLDPRNAERDMARTQAMAGGLYRSFRGVGLDTSSISSMLSLPTNESDKPAAVGTLLTMGGMSYQEYNRAVMSGDLSRIAKAIEQVAATPEPEVNRYLEAGGQESMGLHDIFGSNVKEGMAAIRRRVGTPQSLSNLAEQNQRVVDQSFADPRDSLLADQQEFMRKTAGQWQEFRSNMDQAFANIAKIFDVKNPPVSVIYEGLNGLASKLATFTSWASENPTASMALGTAGSLAFAAGAGLTGLGFARGSVGLMKYALGRGAKKLAGGAPQAVSEGAPAAAGRFMGRLGDGTEIRVLDDLAEGAAGTGGATSAGVKAAGAGSGSFARFARFLGKIAPWLAGGIEAYSTYRDTKSVGKSAGAGLGTAVGGIGGSALALGLAGLLMGGPVGGLAALGIGALGGGIGGWLGGAGGRMGGGWLEDFITGKKSEAGRAPEESVDGIARSFAVEFVRQLEQSAFYEKIAAAVKGQDPATVTSGGTWYDKMVRDGMATPRAEAGPTPQPSRPPMGVPAPEPTPTPQAAATPKPEPTPAATPKPQGFLGESLGDTLARKRIAELEEAAAARGGTPGAAPSPSMPTPAATPEAVATPSPRATPTPPAVRPSAEPLAPGAEPALGTRVMTPSRIEPVPQPTPAPAAASAPAPTNVNVHQSEVVRAVDIMNANLTKQLAQLGRNDMTRRARGPLSRAADAMDI